MIAAVRRYCASLIRAAKEKLKKNGKKVMAMPMETKGKKPVGGILAKTVSPAGKGSEGSCARCKGVKHTVAECPNARSENAADLYNCGTTCIYRYPDGTTCRGRGHTRKHHGRATNGNSSEKTKAKKGKGKGDKNGKGRKGKRRQPPGTQLVRK